MDNNFLVATFSGPNEVGAAVRTLRGQNFGIYDVYGPYPVHGLDQAMGVRTSRLPLIALIAAMLGLVSGVGLQFYTTVLDWPMNVGGKPDNSTLAFVPISFELTVLFSGLITVAALFLRSRLFPGRRENLLATGATDDTFVLVLRDRPSVDISRARMLLESCGAQTVEERTANL